MSNTLSFFRRATFLATGMVVVALLSAGCSSSEEETSDAAPTSGASQAPGAPTNSATSNTLEPKAEAVPGTQMQQPRKRGEK